MRALLAFVLCATAALAQGVDPRPRDGKPVFQTDEEKSASKPEEKPGGEEDGIEGVARRLAGWPSDAAERAAERLIVLKEKSRDMVRRILVSSAKQDEALKPGAAYVLGRIGEPSDFLTLILTAGEAGQQKHARVFLEAAWRLSPEEAVKEAFRFFSLSATTLRREATEFVRQRVTRKNLDAVHELIDPQRSPKPFTREAGLILLDRLVESREVTWEEASPAFYAALGDTSAQVARRAMLLLASRNDAANVARLNELIVAEASYWRQRSYAALSLSVLAGAFRIQPFTPEAIEVLKGERGLTHRKEMLARAAAALGLAQAALRSGDRELQKLLDREIPIILIDSVGASDRHYVDFASVMPLAYGMLRRITGKTFPDEAPAWAHWWQDQGHRFRAQRELIEVDDRDLPETVVDFTPAGGKPVRFAVVGTRPPVFLHGRAFALPKEEVGALVHLLREAGFFTAPEADPAAIEEGSALAAVRVGDLSRTVAYPPGEGRAQVRDRITARLAEVVQEYSWQRWWDLDAQPSWPIFFSENVIWFREHPGNEERATRLRAMIAGALNDLLDADDRLEACRAVRALPGGAAALTSAQIQAFLRAVAHQQEVDAFASDVVDLLVPACGDEAANGLIDALTDKVGPSSRPLLARLMAALPAQRQQDFVIDPRWMVRRAAVSALAAGDAKKARPALLGALQDDEPLVRAEAAVALARLRDPSVMPALKRLEKEDSFEARGAAAYSYGLLGSDEAREALPALLYEDPNADVRIRAIEGIADGGDLKTAGLLIRVHDRESDVRVRAAAASAVLRFESPEVVQMVIERLKLTPSRSPERVALVNVLARFRSDDATPFLRSILQGDDPASADAAALGLARRWDEAALTQLIDMARRGQNARSAVLHLQILTSRRFEAENFEDQARNYADWSVANAGGNPRVWFRDALRERGYDADRLDAFVAGGSLTDEAVPVLLRALRDSDWFLRRNASMLLGRRMGAGAPAELTQNSDDEEIAKAIRAYNDWWGQLEEKKKAEERG